LRVSGNIRCEKGDNAKIAVKIIDDRGIERHKILTDNRDHKFPVLRPMEGRESMQVWHYTIGKYLLSILEDGKLKREAKEHGKRVYEPVVWFSTNPLWEETANKKIVGKGGSLPVTKENTRLHGRGLARIEVFPEAAPYTWADYRQKSKSGKKYLDVLESTAIEDGAKPEEWRVSYKPVFKNQWLAIEVWDSKTNTWIDAMDMYEKTKANIHVSSVR